jgi:hypothetical protein
MQVEIAPTINANDSDPVRSVLTKFSAETLTHCFTRGVADNQKSDPLDQIERLGELREQGVIPDEEFEEEKSGLLDEVRVHLSLNL